MIQDNYKGFALFSDVLDESARSRNRAVVLSNITVDNMRDTKLSPKGVTLVLGYFSAIPKEERQAVQQEYVKEMNTRGFQLS